MFSLILLILALASFVAVAAGASRLNFIAIGLALYVASELVVRLFNT